MKTLIICMSKHGFTEKAAHQLKDNPPGHEVSITNLRKEITPALMILKISSLEVLYMPDKIKRRSRNFVKNIRPF